eukprot:CAMPEP_0185157892 /NCGR_PEP_ID=MMETSP1139-20130426/2069_1 /TAXON_ID=298111 /ORGANISM="Pavlova sp., Strain CCMP459" /LENGTH=101 /DNA_ID=CAMNT_0027722997 /DNA_START=725 /DNA_END=1027 /DNA_ORIENTATION=-
MHWCCACCAGSVARALPPAHGEDSTPCEGNALPGDEDEDSHGHELESSAQRYAAVAQQWCEHVIHVTGNLFAASSAPARRDAPASHMSGSTAARTVALPSR